MNRDDGLGLLGVYGLWAVSVLLSFGLLLMSREAFFIAYDVLGLHEFARVALDKFLFLFAALGVVVVIVFLEHYYRTGLGRRRLIERFFRATGIELLVFFGIQAFIEVAIGGGGRLLLRGIISIQGLAGIAFIVLARYRKQTHHERLARKGIEDPEGGDWN